ncbi:MAG: glycoside hydrolase family 2, partial [Clostridiales bacterium]|nr:glycoside hydrolase family 2 [Clostridiales bacterium]
MSRSRWANRGWKFHLGEISEGSYKGLDDSSWQSVCLPHDWSVSLPFSRDCSSGTGYLPGGIGWYRLRFTLPEEARGKLTRVTFEGIYQNARVWINSNYLGKRPYGYSTFSYDISEFLVPGENVLAVRAEHIDLADSRWFTGAGMTRGVFFTFTDPLHFPENSVFVYTKSADEQKAELGVSWALSGEGQASFVLLDQTGRETARADASGKEGTAALHVDRPLLWSPEQPALYTLKASAYGAEGDLKDEVLIKTGIRTFRFDADEGFFLNG